MVCEAGEMGIRGEVCMAPPLCQWLFGRGTSQQNGHKSSKTTEIHTHIAMKDLRKIKSSSNMMGVGRMNKLVYPSKLEQNVNFVYTKLYAIGRNKT